MEIILWQEPIDHPEPTRPVSTATRPVSMDYVLSPQKLNDGM